jgi:hypothetical protein
MVVAYKQPVRLIQTRTGPRYVVQVPDPQCRTPGWRAYSVLAVGPNGDPPLHLILYERVDGHLEAPDDPQAA